MLIFLKDDHSNVTPKILSHLNKKIYMQQHHPLCLIKEKIINYMHANYRKVCEIQGPLFLEFISKIKFGNLIKGFII